ncbi:MAG: hypothetical protein AAFX54_03145 [Pseudomonadota bacterium]
MMTNLARTTHLNKRKRLKTACAIAAGMSIALTGAANACYSVKVKNDSKLEAKVSWSAFPCTGHEFECKHKIVKPGKTVSYNYNWGVTSPNVFVQVASGQLRKEVGVAFYTYDGHKFRQDAKTKSPGGCGGNYSVSFTQSDVNEALQQALSRSK